MFWRKRKDERTEAENERAIEIRKLQEIAQLSSIYYRDRKNFEKNRHLSHVVHAILHIAECVCGLFTEIFHVMHLAINEKMRENDPNVPELPEGRNPVFFCYPICIIISLVLAVLWLAFRTFRRIIEMTLAGCAIGILLMLLAGIVEMRHAEIYINLEEVSDDQLMEHPVFMHNFFMCVISIIILLIYLIHFWITFDCWQWRNKERIREIEIDEPSASSMGQGLPETISLPETSKKDENERARDAVESIPTWDMLKKELAEGAQTKVEDEPVILYCCLVDCWRYLRERDDRKPIHEFHVVHIK